MNQKQAIRRDVQAQDWTDAKEFARYFDPDELEIVLQVAREEMELAADRDDAERYNQLDDYIGEILNEIERLEEQRAFEEVRHSRYSYYDSLWGTKASWY